VTIASAMNWTAGSMSGSGRTIISPSVMLNLAGPGAVSLGRMLENAGTVHWTGAWDIFFIAFEFLFPIQPGHHADEQHSQQARYTDARQSVLPRPGSAISL